MAKSYITILVDEDLPSHDPVVTLVAFNGKKANEHTSGSNTKKLEILIVKDPGAGGACVKVGNTWYCP